MNKQLSKLLFVGALAASAFPSAYAAAGSEGHGGGAFICPNATDSEFLDLYEARLNGYRISTSSDSVDNQITVALTKLQSARFKNIFALYAQVRAAGIVTPPQGQDLAWPSDSLNAYAKQNCPGKGIMLYYDGRKNQPDLIEQDTAALNSLTNTQQAAAWVHETVYKYMRKHYGETNSVISQIWTGFAFSNETEDQALAAVVAIAHAPIGACWSGNVCSNQSQASCEAYANFGNVWNAGICPNI